ncbi:MAG: hypothetical protein A2Z28_08045 [Chloroflexi bacterium RBG_16_51_9]|nr:MAG: hypothetical protein A2Z28_08045 [Chloroflexi bacterium RBG_16_51_9]
MTVWLLLEEVDEVDAHRGSNVIDDILKRTLQAIRVIRTGAEPGCYKSRKDLDRLPDKFHIVGIALEERLYLDPQHSDFFIEAVYKDGLLKIIFLGINKYLRIESVGAGILISRLSALFSFHHEGIIAQMFWEGQGGFGGGRRINDGELLEKLIFYIF